MQILTKKQVRYCRIVTEKSTAVHYCLGVSFQNKLFVTDKFFAGDRQQQAIDYCYRKYLTDRGSTSCILLSNAAGLTVWVEDKYAKIVGEESPDRFIQNLEIGSFVVQMRDARILISDRRNDSETNKSLDSLDISLQKILSWEQGVRDRFWLWSVESIEPFFNHQFNASSWLK